MDKMKDTLELGRWVVVYEDQLEFRFFIIFNFNVTGFEGELVFFIIDIFLFGIGFKEIIGVDVVGVEGIVGLCVN